MRLTAFSPIGAAGLPRKTAEIRAFTLLELLVVVALMVLLMALVVPAMTSIMAGENIAQAGNIVTDQIALARQIASTRNSTVQVRLINIPPAQGYSALQLWVSGTGNTMTPAGKVIPLPQSVVISQDKTNLSPMLSYLSSTGTGTMTAGATQNATYVSFSLRPSGEVAPVVTGAAARASLYLTVLPARLAAATTAPPNYATIQLNPDSGTPLLYRP